MKRNLLSFVFVVFSAITALAGENSPLCMGNGQPLPVINEQIIQWKSQTKNQYKNRGHIEGVLTKIYPKKTGHVHIQVKIGERAFDTIEVIYNEKFGKVGAMQLGAVVEACGDYITSKARAGGYQPSPDGAILHWVHYSTNTRHDSGYMMIDGVVYGAENSFQFDTYPELVQ